MSDILVDTSAFIEWLIGSKTGQHVATLLPENARWLIPTLVQFELAKWARREQGEDKADEIIAFTQTCVVVPLSTSMALRAAEVGRQHKLATADAIVYATALELDAEFLTCDAHFKDITGITFQQKID